MAVNTCASALRTRGKALHDHVLQPAVGHRVAHKRDPQPSGPRRVHDHAAHLGLQGWGAQRRRDHALAEIHLCAGGGPRLRVFWMRSTLLALHCDCKLGQGGGNTGGCVGIASHHAHGAPREYPRAAVTRTWLLPQPVRVAVTATTGFGQRSAPAHQASSSKAAPAARTRAASAMASSYEMSE
jgi:hypothetical protein